MTSYILHHSGAVDWPIGMISPYEPQGFYNYMKGFWRDGTPLTYGGDGYFENGEITTYAFPDNPSDPDGWSMCSENMPWGDRRTVMGTGPVYFAPGEVLEFTYALLFVPDVPHPCPDVTPLIEAGQEVQDLFDQITGYEVLEMESEKVYFHPNPMRDMARLALKQPGNRIANLTLYNASGMKLRQYNSVFRGNLHIYRENLPAGIYFYQLETENGARYSGKIIMQ